MRALKPTNKMIKELMLDVRSKLKEKNHGQDMSFTVRLPKLMDKEPALILMSHTAEEKTNALIRAADKEIGWHGVIRRDENEPNIFHVDDILLFPQTVTGATVTTDDVEYAKWMMELDSGTFNNMRLYGHSHVNMAVSPSGVDDTYQDNLLENVNDFYIFVILNKQGKAWANIYDFEYNILYEDDDITIDTMLLAEEQWANTNITQYVKNKTYTRVRTGYNNAQQKFNTSNLKPALKKEETPAERDARLAEEDAAYWEKLYGINGYYGRNY